MAHPITNIGDPHRRLIVFRNGRHIGLIILKRAFKIHEIQVTEYGQVAPREMVSGINRERRIVTRFRFLESPRFSVQNTQFIVRNWVIAVRRDGQVQLRFRVFEATGTVVGDSQVDTRRA